MNDLKNNNGRTNPTDYQANISVTQLDRNNNPLKVYTLFSAFPTNLSDIVLNYGDNDTIETYTVEFQYQHYETTFDTLLSAANTVNNTIGSGTGILGI